MVDLFDMYIRSDTSKEESLQEGFNGMDSLPSLAPNLQQIPSPPSFFLGRQGELDGLLDFGKNNTQSILGVHGREGMGKTALALVAVEELKPYYPDAQLYIDLRGSSHHPLSPEIALSQWIRILEPQVSKLYLPEDLHELSAIFCALLDGKKALLLADNAYNVEQVLPLKPPAGSLLLVTSRQRFTIPDMVGCKLEALSDTNAVSLLENICGQERLEASALKLARLCGGVPLALCVAGGSLNIRPDLTIEKLCQRLQHTARRLKLSNLKRDVRTRAALHVGYEQISNKSWRATWRRIAVFEGDFDLNAVLQVSHEQAAENPWRAIWRWLAVFTRKMPTGGTDVPTSKRSERIDATLKGLVKGSLLEWDEHKQRYYWHSLLRELARKCSTEQEWATAQLRHALYYFTLLWQANTLFLQGKESRSQGLALADSEWYNILEAQYFCRKAAERDNEQALELICKFPDAGANILDLRLHPFQRIAWLDAALAAARRLDRRNLEGAHLANMGSTYQILGDLYRAMECYEQSLVIMRRLGDKRSEANNLNNLGILSTEMGKLPQALNYYQEYLSIVRTIGDLRSESNALNNLGKTYRSMENLPKALTCYQQGLYIVRRLDDRRCEGTVLNNLGTIYAEMGDVQHAQECYDLVLSMMRELGDRRNEGITLSNLGEAYQRAGEIQRAMEYYEKSLSIAREIGDQRGEGNAYWNMALAKDQAGETHQAVQYAHKALKIRENIADPDAEMVRHALRIWEC